MKHGKLHYLFTATLLALALVPLSIRAQSSNITINTFASSDELLNWVKWWGSAPVTFELDPNVDASGNTNTSGALKVVVDFDRVAYGGDNQFSIRGGFTGTNSVPTALVVDGTKYTNLVFDLFWATNSPTRPWGDLGGLEAGLVPSDYSQIWFPGFGVPVTNGWQKITLPINPTAPKLEMIGAVVLKMWSGDASWGQTGTATFWIDNIRLIALVGPPPPPPTLAIHPAESGLQLTAASAGQYDRQSIHTIDPFYSWVNASTSVTYSVTIKDYPSSSYPSFQTHIFLAPSAGIPYGPGDTSVDWNSTNLIFVQIQNLASGGGSAAFMYKTNVSNPTNRWDDQIFGSNTLGTVFSTNVIGTWSLTFSNNTNVVLKAPDGSSTNFIMPSTSAELFLNPLYAWFGVQANTLANVGQKAVFSRIQIAGGVSPEIDDNFATGPLNNTIWGLAAQGGASAVQVADTGTAFALSWSLPDTGFTLQFSPTLTPPTWSDPGLTPVQVGARKQVFIPSTLSPTNSGYFRLLKPPS